MNKPKRYFPDLGERNGGVYAKMSEDDGSFPAVWIHAGDYEALAKRMGRLEAVARETATLDCFHTGYGCPENCKCLSAEATRALAPT